MKKGNRGICGFVLAAPFTIVLPEMRSLTDATQKPGRALRRTIGGLPGGKRENGEASGSRSGI